MGSAKSQRRHYDQRRLRTGEMISQMTLRSKFIAGFSALLFLTGALAFTSVHAMNSLNSELDRVVHHMWAQAYRTSQLEATLAELADYQQAIMLRSIVSDSAGVELNRAAAVQAEPLLGTLFSYFISMLDSAADRQFITNLQSR